MDTSDKINLLRWQLDSGADEFIEIKPVNRLKNGLPHSKPKDNLAKQTENITDPVETIYPPKNISKELFTSTLEKTNLAETVDELKLALEDFEGCSLKATATNLVFAHGNPTAKLMFVGEAPGTEEDRNGIPFFGKSGQLLNKMIASIGLERSKVMVCNTVFWRPPGNRPPTPHEVALCLPFLERLIQLVNPSILVCLGGPASKTLFGTSEGIGRIRGKWFSYQNSGMPNPIDSTAMFHPKYLNQTPKQKHLAWRDLLTISEKLAVKVI